MEQQSKSNHNRIRISKKEAEKIYSTGGKIIVTYVFDGLDKSFNKEASFRFIDDGVTFEYIQSIYKMSGIRDVEYFAEADVVTSSEMCDLMCN